MRMRKKKNGEARLSACSEFLFEKTDEPMSDPGAWIGKPGAAVFLEIGAGKGGFACGMAAKNPGVAYFAMERVTDCVVLAAEQAKETASQRDDNLRFIVDTADNLLKIFKPGTVDAIFLNFSDPWPKKKQAKRRLTHPTFLKMYKKWLSEDGEIFFKTDNEKLFEFSLNSFCSEDFILSNITFDLHKSDFEGNIMTEYETKFAEEGKNIFRLEARKRL